MSRREACRLQLIRFDFIRYGASWVARLFISIVRIANRLTTLVLARLLLPGPGSKKLFPNIDNQIVNMNNDNLVVKKIGVDMSTPVSKDSYQIIWLVRRLFRALARESNRMLEDLGISAADRAVMEFLYPDRQLSVPAIAAQYQVSRQHVQATVNALLEAGFVVTRDNPRHQRSPLIVLNASGRKLFDRVSKREAKVVDALFADVSGRELQITRQTLQSLLNELSKE
ncbi:MAG: MarR family winged helix-turn-helix transcriptional regulator [Gammaproteobacteria bacterium]|jgi:DNA-binding MarR family transcriptional regulator